MAAPALSPTISTSILKNIHQALLNYLQALHTRDRAKLLDFLIYHDSAFLRALGISQEGYNQIAESIIAICTHGEWL